MFNVLYDKTNVNDHANRQIAKISLHTRIVILKMKKDCILNGIFFVNEHLNIVLV